MACYLEDPLSMLEVLLVNCHLYGTNKYGVGEAVFDEVCTVLLSLSRSLS